MKRIEKIWFAKNRIFMETESKETFSRPLEAFPLLMDATETERKNYTIGTDRTDIRWDGLDEDIHIESFFIVCEPDFNNNLAIALKKFPFLDLSVLAKEIGIHKSLLAKYVYGMKKPSDKARKKIENTLHSLDKRLLEVEL